MTSLTGPLPRPCFICVVGGARWGKHCPLRDAVRAETGKDVACYVCGAHPSPERPLMTDEYDRWHCGDYPYLGPCPEEE
jgi:hypothetical protein